MVRICIDCFKCCWNISFWYNIVICTEDIVEKSVISKKKKIKREPMTYPVDVGLPFFFLKGWRLSDFVFPESDAGIHVSFGVTKFVDNV